MKICIKCGKVTSYNSHFKADCCSQCGHMEYKKELTIQNNNGGFNSYQIELIKQLGEEGYVQELYDFLQGKYHPENITDNDKPNLTPDQAWHVIYCLQEYFGMLDDRFERCKVCGDIYDSYESGTNINEDTEPEMILDEDGNYVEREWKESEYGNYCDNCRPD